MAGSQRGFVIYRGFMVRKLKIKECHDYWRNPPDENRPSRYASKQSAGIVVDMVNKHLNTSAMILELGCNVGLNLRCLYENGYLELAGVEINSEAVDYMRTLWPEMQFPIYEGSIEEHISNLPFYDLVFTKAVLCHIHDDSEWIFEKMVQRTKYILTVEDELTFKSRRHFCRNYRDVFEGLGMEQIDYVENVPTMNRAYRARMFVKQ